MQGNQNGFNNFGGRRPPMGNQPFNNNSGGGGNRPNINRKSALNWTNRNFGPGNRAFNGGNSGNSGLPLNRKRNASRDNMPNQKPKVIIKTVESTELYVKNKETLLKNRKQRYTEAFEVFEEKGTIKGLPVSKNQRRRHRKKKANQLKAAAAGTTKDNSTEKNENKERENANANDKEKPSLTMPFANAADFEKSEAMKNLFLFEEYTSYAEETFKISCENVGLIHEIEEKTFNEKNVVLHLKLDNMYICQSRSGEEDLYKIALRRLKQFFRTLKSEHNYSNYQIVTRFTKELKLKTGEEANEMEHPNKEFFNPDAIQKIINSFIETNDEFDLVFSSDFTPEQYQEIQEYVFYYIIFLCTNLLTFF